jgi:hypothetical protein
MLQWVGEQVLKPQYLIESCTDDYEDPAEELSGAMATAEPQRIYSGAIAEVELSSESTAEPQRICSGAADMTTPFARRERMIRFISEHYTFVPGAHTSTRVIKDAFLHYANSVPPFTEAQMNSYISHAMTIATTTGQTLTDQGVQTKPKWDGTKLYHGYLNLGPVHGCAPP